MRNKEKLIFLGFQTRNHSLNQVVCHAMHILKNLPNEMEEVRFFEFSERFARRGILAGLNSGENVTVRTRCNPFLETRTRAQWKENACNLLFPFVRQMDIFFFPENGNWKRGRRSTFEISFSIRSCEISLIL